MKKLLIIVLLFMPAMSLFGMEQDQENIRQAFNACRSGDDKTLKTLLESGLNPDIALGAPLVPYGYNDTRLLHWAASCNRGNIVDLLLEYKVNVQVVDENKRTPLCNAIANLHCDIVQKLLNADAKVNVTDWMGKTPLHRISSHKIIKTSEGKLKVLKIITLLRAHGAQSWKLTTFFDSPFHYIAGANNPALIYSLIMPIKTEDQKRAELIRIKKLLPIIMPAAQFISEKVLKKRRIDAHVCNIKEVAKGNATTNIQAIKACMTEQEIAVIELTLDTQNRIGKKPMDLATNPTVKALLDPKAWQLSL